MIFWAGGVAELGWEDAIGGGLQVVYPDLPVARRRDDIAGAIRKSRVVVVVVVGSRVI